MDFTFASELHYLIHHADGETVAHCLELDLVGSGADQKEAVDSLDLVVRSLVMFAMTVKSPELVGMCKRAPNYYWDMFEEARKNGTQTRTLEVNPDIAPVNVYQCKFTCCLAVAA